MEEDGQALVFINTTKLTEEIFMTLKQLQVEVRRLHSLMPQRHRDLAVEHMRRGKASVLVCTDVACRGLDLPQVSLVVH